MNKMELIEFIEQLKVVHPINGYVKFKLYDFQKELLNYLQLNDQVVITKSRQLGISTLLCGYMLYSALYQKQKIGILTPNLKQTKQLIDKIRQHVAQLKLNTITNNANKVEFENGSIISLIDLGAKYDIIVADEIDYVSDRKLQSFSTTTFNKLIITQTNKCEYTDNLLNDNSIAHYVLPWHVHPTRDEKWKE